jgi:hypothetical protein
VNTRTKKIIAPLLAILAFTVCTSMVMAQPCANFVGPLTVINGSPCPVQLNLVSIPPIPAINLAPGAAAVVGIPPGAVLTGVTSAGGIFYPFPAGPPFPACIQKVTLGPQNCCADVCYDPINCIVHIVPKGPPCNP